MHYCSAVDEFSYSVLNELYLRLIIDHCYLGKKFLSIQNVLIIMLFRGLMIDIVMHTHQSKVYFIDHSTLCLKKHLTFDLL